MRLNLILTGKCPVCAKGDIFFTFWKMNHDCPACGIHFQRESGYFSMSIFIGYIMAGVIGLPFLLLAIFTGLSLFWIVALPSAAIVLTSPLIFRYARIIWIHFDEWIDPRPESERSIE